MKLIASKLSSALASITAIEEERFWSGISTTESGCWRYAGALTKGGYCNFHISRMTTLAHRFSYHLVHGDIPVGLDLDHLCRNRWCVNPHHLEAVTRSVNLRRGIGPQLMRDKFAAQTSCKRGHEYTKENTKYKRGSRVCLTCRREQDRISQRARRAKAA